MNRRTLLQALSVSPLALLPSVAEAAAAAAPTPINEEGKAKLFSAHLDVQPEHFEHVFSYSQRKHPGVHTGHPRIDLLELPGPKLSGNGWMLFEWFGRVVQATTRQPDIFRPAKIYLTGHDGQDWGRSWNFLNSYNYNFDYQAKEKGLLLVDSSELIRDPVPTIRHAIMHAVEDVLGNSYLKGRRGMEGEMYNPDSDVRKAFHKKVRDTATGIARVGLDFFYYGPTPYPLDGRILRFDFKTETWVPAR